MERLALRHQARDWYAIFYLQLGVGRLDEGVAQAKQALDSDPFLAMPTQSSGTPAASPDDMRTDSEHVRWR